MRGKKAKAIRKSIYGDVLPKFVKRTYYERTVRKLFLGKEVLMRTIINTPDSLRAKYQRTKKSTKTA